MDANIKLYWEAYKEIVTNEAMLQDFKSPLKIYESSFVDGPIVDIGCGQSIILLDYSRTDRELFAIDKEKFQLSDLKERMVRLNGEEKNTWHFQNLSFPNHSLPSSAYSVVILSNFLHFFSLKSCESILKKIKVKTVAGSLLYVVVHSTKHYTNKPGKRGNNAYFKHFFSTADLDGFFCPTEFQCLYMGDVQRMPSKQECAIRIRLLEKFCKERTSLILPM